jgi:hypothetical protein
LTVGFNMLHRAFKAEFFKYISNIYKKEQQSVLHE